MIRQSDVTPEQLIVKIYNKEEVVNSCRVCRSPNQDGDYECLYAVQVVEEDGVIQAHTWQLTNTGKLYEDMLGVEIDAATMEIYPQYLCNSCDLQMRLFRKLTMRARRTLEELAKMYPPTDIKTSAVSEVHEETENAILETPNTLDEEFLENEISTLDNESNLMQSLLAETNLQAQNNYEDIKAKSYDASPIETIHFAHDTPTLESTMEEADSKEFLNDIQAVSLDNTEMRYFEEDQEASMQPTMIANQKTKQEKRREIEFVSLFEEHIAEDQEQQAREEPVEFFDVHYLEDTYSGLPINALERPKVFGDCNGGNIRRAYECKACNLEFLRRTDFLQHRKSVHDNKFPCPLCSKLLHTNDALRVHLRLHGGEPAYKCEICQRTFNQKVHFRYHMDRHNNVRNFKCTQCEKAFLSKHDLTVHTRTHTGERPYECEICGKDFLILQHLKMHRYSHTNKSFECPECKQKFISPSTLRIHQHTIHAAERRFQCEYCVKRFRRKHHLIAHYRVHQKSEMDTNNFDDYVEQGENDIDIDGYQMPASDAQTQQLAVIKEDECEYLEINADENIDNILVVDDDDEAADRQALYGADYVIGVAEECNANLTF
ncbi:zinc finger and SCAN domain-containing protein 12 isoform X1 [Ceratitis capitata]|uniref:zinc finger and SCAN domain-containing protein 12 isoform X1 n=1 Tax=Ceratitis capitata TaxID=7213 RepID=UPI000A1110A7|nr:zinc finger and SCAN domain-containing protein 12 isoform X1 [Ceratitis capitata]